MRRFTLSYHYFTQRDTRNHLELFLDVADEAPLETWRLFRGQGQTRTDGRKRFVAAPEHRRVYLDFSGNVSAGRGKLRIVRRGFFVDQRTRMSVARTAQDVHPSANRRTENVTPNSILVTL